MLDPWFILYLQELTLIKIAIVTSALMQFPIVVGFPALIRPGMVVGFLALLQHRTVGFLALIWSDATIAARAFVLRFGFQNTPPSIDEDTF